MDENINNELNWHLPYNILDKYHLCVLVLPTDLWAGDGLDLVQSLRQTVFDLWVVQRKQIPRSGQIPLPQHLAEQLVHSGPGLGLLLDQFGTGAPEFKIP